LLPAPAASGIFPTLSLRILPRMSGPLPRRVTTECVYLFLPPCHRPSPTGVWVGLPASTREHDFPRSVFSRLQTFLYVQTSEFAHLPDRSYRCAYCRRAAEAFTSEQNMLRYLRMHRICLPPEYRQLAAQGLSPRQIRGLVGCSVGIEHGRAPL